MKINYTKLWKLLIDKNMKKQDLRVAAGISTSTISKLGRGEDVTTAVLSKICVALSCDVGDIMEIISPTKKQKIEPEQVIKEKSDCNKKLGVISLFSGAGGLDIGFEKAGFSIAVALEADAACCSTLRRNKPLLPIINEKIENVTSDTILQVASLKPLEAALVIGGPPCQSFSLAGLRKGLEDERGKLLFEYVRVIRDTLPRGFVFENVKGLANWDGGKAMRLLIQELSKPIEYNGVKYTYTITQPKIVNAADYGAPQHRERVIIVGNREAKSFVYPPNTKDKDSYLTVWDAIGQLPAPEKPSETAVRVAASIRERRERHGY